MKKKTFIVYILVAFIFSNSFAQNHGTKVVCKWFKNNSAVEGNDFHLSCYASSYGWDIPKLYNASAKNAAGQGCFPDTLNSNIENANLDWLTTTNLIPIPAGDSIKICAEVNAWTYFDDDSYLTRNGTAIGTKAISSDCNFQSTSPNSCLVSIQNTDSLNSINISSLEVYVDNSPGSISTTSYNPDGVLVPGIPTSLVLAPGQIVTYPCSFSFPSNYISARYLDALSSDPSDTFEESAWAIQAETFIPTLPQWGLIILGLLLVGMASFVLLKRPI